MALVEKIMKTLVQPNMMALWSSFKLGQRLPVYSWSCGCVLRPTRSCNEAIVYTKCVNWPALVTACVVHKLKPLAQSIGEDVWESVDVAQDDIVCEGEGVEVRRQRQLAAWVRDRLVLEY